MRNFEVRTITTLEERLEALMEHNIANHSIPVEFPFEVQMLASKDLTAEPCKNRRDLRTLEVFTIDCHDTKDIDDAVSLEKVGSGYRLGVHIADVASYVTPGSLFEDIAVQRGTSIYLPHITIPMLPEILSNNLCSLNPEIDRNTVSVFADLDCDGNVTNYEITKSLIHSRVKGDYIEVDSILSGKSSKAVAKKYSGLTETLFSMEDLSKILRSRRIENGATISTVAKAKFRFENQKIECSLEEKGASAKIIEEFMVLANSLVAKYFKEYDLPCILRSQEHKGTQAKYTAAQGGHAELALERYAHFTSPIRRLADLKMHQVLTAHLNGKDAQTIRLDPDYDFSEMAIIATKRELRAENLDVVVRKFYTDEFLSTVMNNEFLANCVGLDSRNRPIFHIRKYALRVVGPPSMPTYEGAAVAIKLGEYQKLGRIVAASCTPIRNKAA